MATNSIIPTNPLLATLFNLFCWLLFTLILPVVIVVMLPLRIYKTIIILLATKFKNYKSTLRGYDSIFAIDKVYERPYAANATFLVLDTSLGVEKLRGLFSENVLGCRHGDYDRLKQIPCNFGGFYFWKEIELDIRRHVRVVHDFAKKKKSSTPSLADEEELNTLLGQLMTSPFPKGSSLWELLLLENYQGSKSVVLFRLHHVLGDGYTVNRIVDLLLGVQSEYLVSRSGEEGGDSTWKRVKLLATCPSRLASLYIAAFTHRGHDYFTIPKKSNSGLVSFTKLDLDLMKSLRRRTGVHFATLGMSLLVGALRRYYSEDLKRTNLQLNTSIMHSLPRPHHPLTSMVNHWAVGLFTIPFQTPDPVKRLLEAEDGFVNYMEAGYKEIIHYHMPLFNLLPSILVEWFFNTNFGTGVGFTSLPGVQQQEGVELGGGRVEGAWKLFGMQWSQTALASAMYTTCGQLGFTVYVNKDVISSQEDLNRITQIYMREEMTRLKKELDNL